MEITDSLVPWPHGQACCGFLGWAARDGDTDEQIKPVLPLQRPALWLTLVAGVVLGFGLLD